MVLPALPNANAEVGSDAMAVALEGSTSANQMVVMRAAVWVLRSSATAMAFPSPPRMPCGAAMRMTRWLSAAVRFWPTSISRAASIAQDVQPWPPPEGGRLSIALRKSAADDVRLEITVTLLPYWITATCGPSLAVPYS